LEWWCDVIGALLPSVDREQHPTKTSPSVTPANSLSSVALRTRLTTGVPFSSDACSFLPVQSGNRTTTTIAQDIA
jgi:hypothetical protein